jgi:acetyl esterase/lipase
MKIHDNATIAHAVRHALSDADRERVAVMRQQVAPFKGKMGDPSARGPFDEVMAHTPDAPDVTYEDAEVGGVAGVRCVPRNARSDAAILYLHGGAYLLGSARAYRHFAGQFAARTSTTAFIAEYRLAPEHAFPAAVDDAQAAYRGLVKEGAQKIVVIGDSAGGGLTLVTLALGQSEASMGRGLAPSGALVMSPWTDLALTGASLRERADEDPLLTTEMLAKARVSYLRDHDPRDPRASPFYGSLVGLPPIQLHVGASEILLDDTRRYAEKARSAGVDATAHVWDGMTHVFPSSVGLLDAAERAFGIMTSFLTEILGAP